MGIFRFSLLDLDEDRSSGQDLAARDDNLTFHLGTSVCNDLKCCSRRAGN